MMPGIYDNQVDQIKQRAQQQNTQNAGAMQRRMAAMGGGPAGAAEKLQLQSQNQVQQNAESAIAGVNANQAQEEMQNQRSTAAADATRGFEQKGREQQNEQFGANLGFQQGQAKEQNAIQRRSQDMQQQQFDQQMKMKREQDEQDNNFFSGKNLGSLARGAIGVGAGLLMSDENTKENIKEADAEIGEFLDGINAKSYDYKDEEHGTGKQFGVIAQDVDKHPVGKSFIVNTPKGKMLDMAKGSAVVLAAQSSLNRRLKKLEESI